jgi:predicted N-acetyltransferase YhbS
MSEGAIIRPYREGDEKQIVELLVKVFDGWPCFDIGCSPLDHWRWKHRDNPTKRMVAAVAEVDGRIVGCFHGLFSRVRVGGRSLLNQQGVDLAVDNEYRRLGIYERMRPVKDQLAKDAGVNIGYGFSTNPTVKRKLREHNTPFPTQIKQMIRIRDLDLHLRATKVDKRVMYKYGYIGLHALNRLGNAFASRTEPSGFEIARVEGFGEEIEPLWEEVRGHYNFVIERDADYLNWRYSDRRGGDYVIKEAIEGERALGYVVLRVNRDQKNYPVGYIVDLLALPGRMDVAGALLRDAVGFMDALGINSVLALVFEGNPNRSLLKVFGFLDGVVRYSLGYRVYDLGDELRILETSPPEKLHFMWGDLDWI